MNNLLELEAARRLGNQFLLNGFEGYLRGHPCDLMQTKTPKTISIKIPMVMGQS